MIAIFSNSCLVLTKTSFSILTTTTLRHQYRKVCEADNALKQPLLFHHHHDYMNVELCGSPVNLPVNRAVALNYK